MTNYESIKNMSIEDMAKMNVKAFMYMNGYRSNVEYHTTDQSIFDTREEAEEYELKWLQSNEDRETLDTITFKNRRKRWFTGIMKGGTAMDSRFFERKCFATTSDCLLEFMKEQKDDSSLIFNMEEDTKEVFLYSPAFDVEYNEDDIMDCVGRDLGVEINNLFVDGDKYCAAIYFTVRKLEQWIGRLEVDYMNETQEKIYGLLESYLEYCKTNGYTEFEVWCEDNIDTVDEDSLVQDIYQEVNHIADKLFE